LSPVFPPLLIALINATFRFVWFDFPSFPPTSRAAFVDMFVSCPALLCSDRTIEDDMKQNKGRNDLVVKVFINPKTGEWQRDQGQEKPKYWTEKDYHWLFLPSAHQERAPWEYSAGTFHVHFVCVCVCTSAPGKKKFMHFCMEHMCYQEDSKYTTK
jgi:hypothetical protein